MMLAVVPLHLALDTAPTESALLTPTSPVPGPSPDLDDPVFLVSCVSKKAGATGPRTSAINAMRSQLATPLYPSTSTQGCCAGPR